MALFSPTSTFTPADPVNGPLTNAANAFDGNSSTFATGDAAKLKVYGSRFTLGGDTFPQQMIYVGVEIDWECTAIHAGTSRITSPHASGAEILVDRDVTFTRTTERFLFSTPKRYTDDLGVSVDIYAIGGPSGSGVGSTITNVYELRFIEVPRGIVTVIDG